jgi:hypothetical protein
MTNERECCYQRIRNAKVEGSTPSTGTKESSEHFARHRQNPRFPLCNDVHAAGQHRNICARGCEEPVHDGSSDEEVAVATPQMSRQR